MGWKRGRIVLSFVFSIFFLPVISKHRLQRPVFFYRQNGGI